MTVVTCVIVGVDIDQRGIIMTVLEYLQEQNLKIRADCGGNGTCGKCLVEIVDEGGYRSLHKACKITYKEGMDIRVVDKPEDMTILSLNNTSVKEKGSSAGFGYERKKAAKYGVAIDIGTTTIAGVITEINNGEENKTVCDTAVINSGRLYGNDVISRIRAAGEGKNAEITALLRKDISAVISKLIMKSGINEISVVSIAANPTMVHFLMGFDVSGLGAYPYRTVDIDMITTALGMITEGLGFIGDIQVYIMPAVSAFVGGDILSGLFYCGAYYEKENTLFIDLGTNGEMALYNKEDILTASTAAGPVFEGSSISCGTGGTDGAVYYFDVDKNGNFRYKTINNLPPTGICGTGVIEITAALLKKGLITPEGNMENDFRVARRSNGSYIELTQEDIRQVQLAKAAIRTGVDLLIKKRALSYQDIKRVYLAGGFGYNIDVKKAAVIGMLPAELTERTEAPGNTSLLGAIKFIRGDIEKNIYELEQIRSRCDHIDLAMEDEFQETYINEINFRHCTEITT